MPQSLNHIAHSFRIIYRDLSLKAQIILMLIGIVATIFLCRSLTTVIGNVSNRSDQVPTSTPTPTAHPSDQYSRANDIVLAGKLVNSTTNAWPNRRIVLLYLKGIEIARAETTRGELPQSGAGINDGFFMLTSANLYGLSMDTINRNPASLIDFFYVNNGGFFSPHSYLYHWFNQIEEGSTLRIPIPAKNIEYVLVSLPGEKESLPPEILTPGSTQLRPDGRIIFIPPPNPDAQTTELDPNLVIRETSYAIKEELIEVNRFSVPSNNCNGNSDITQKFIKTQSYTHQYKQEVGFELKLPLPVWPALVAALQTKYGFEQGQVNSETLEYTIVTKPGTNQEATFVWKEKWESGLSKVAVGSQTFEVPFRVKKELIYEVENQQLPCQ